MYDRLAVRPENAALARRSRDLDVLRAIAALLVVVSHAYLISGPDLGPTDRSAAALLVNGSGAAGVSLFFVLSGFLIAGPYLRVLLEGDVAPDTRRYLRRRATRILPAYWLALVAAFLLITPLEGVAWWQIPLHALLLQSFVPGEGAAVLLVAWSLTIEAAFYLAVPLVAAVVRRRRRRSGPVDAGTLARGVLALWGFGLVWGVAVALTLPDPESAGDVLRISLPGFLAGFCPGLLIYLAEHPMNAGRGGAWAAYRALVRRPAAVLALAAAAWLAGMLMYTSTSPVVVDLGKHGHALAAGLVFAAAYQGLGARRRVVAVLAPVGLVSYGIYLWHWIVVGTVLRHDVTLVGGSGVAAYAVHLGAVVAVSVLLGLVSWLVVERPLLRRSAPHQVPAPLVPDPAPA